MGETSASEQLHGLLMQEDVGYKFTMESLKTKVSDAGLNQISEGAITGFIHRAVCFDRVQIVGKAVGNNGRMLHQYEIVDREPWSFKTKSRGSTKGRKIGKRNYQELPKQGIHVDPEPLKSTNYPIQSLLSDRMFALAVEAAELERKSLKDYTSDELINELKRRIK